VNVRNDGTTVRVQLRAGGRRLGSAVRRGAQPGPLTLDVPLNRRGRSALARRSRLRLSVRVTATPASGSPVSAVRRVTLRR